jgi:predicted lipoprotein with Yx(FWY)xxD motif
MTLIRRTALSMVVGCLLGLVAAPLAMSLADMSPTPPVVKVKNSTFGNILQSKNRLPLYYWSVEKRAGGKIRCIGECARVWPPLIVKSRKTVPSRLPGVRGIFGVVRRADGRLQVTHRGLPLYAYHDDPPNTVLCNNVDGWFVVRV